MTDHFQGRWQRWKHIDPNQAIFKAVWRDSIIDSGILRGCNAVATTCFIVILAWFIAWPISAPPIFSAALAIWLRVRVGVVTEAPWTMFCNQVDFEANWFILTVPVVPNRQQSRWLSMWRNQHKQLNWQFMTHLVTINSPHHSKTPQRFQASGSCSRLQLSRQHW